MAEKNKVLVTKKEMKAKASKNNWRPQIVKFLTDNPGSTLEAIIKATHPTGLDSEGLSLSPEKMKHNFASQKTYLKDDGYLVVSEENKFYIVTKPIPGDREHVEVTDQDRYNRLG